MTKKDPPIGQKSTIYNFKHFEIIQQNFGQLNPEQMIHFMTFSRWHSYELLLYILSFSGKANITITTFGLSEEAIRTLQKIKNAGLINNLTIIMNLSAQKYKKKLLYYLDNFGDIYLQNIHAKIFLIENDKFQCVVNQSANFSRNPTNETGILTTKKQDIIQYSAFLKETLVISKKMQLNEL